MRFQVLVSAGFEVRWPSVVVQATGHIADSSASNGWLIDMNRFEAFVDAGLREQSFGESIETFFLGFEIADVGAWRESFGKTKKYVSYRPKVRGIVSVAQLSYPEVKDLAAGEQLVRLGQAVEQAILRIGTMKRKPRDFDYEEMAVRVGRRLAACDLKEVVRLENGS